MMKMDSTFAIVFCLVQWKLLARAQLVTCESSGLCQETGQRCQPETLNSCFPGSGSVPRKYATYDDVAGERVLSRCSQRSKCTGPGNTSTNIILQDLTLEYVSVDPKHFNVRVSWSLTNTSGYLGGYELRVSTGDRIFYCYCVENSNRTRLILHNMRYDNVRTYEMVDVLPYPDPRSSEDAIKVSQLIHHDINGCADIEHKGTICNIKPYPKPENLSVETCVRANDTKRLDITWDPPNVHSDVPLPDIYHIYLFDETRTYSRAQYFTVRNASQVLLANLSAAHNYSVEVVPYRTCSGLGSVDSRIGCGSSSDETRERLLGSCDSVYGITTETYYNSTTMQYTMKPFNATRNPYLIPVLTSVMLAVTIALVVVVALAVVHCVKLNKHHEVDDRSCICLPKTGDYVYKVFVFYSSHMSHTHNSYIQKHVICNLLKYFKVITSNDISRGNISIWLEDAVNSADSVLLVGNEEFCSEWEKKERSPTLNSLELIISAAASRNTIAKFGFISIEKSEKDVAIPDNSYLKLMPVFFMGEKKCEMEKIYRFVTRSRGIDLAQEVKQDCVKF